MTLVEQTREAGLDVELTMEGVEDPLPAAVELSAYRIVQEALTNVLKHAGPRTRTEVSVRGDGHGVSVEVRDDGDGPAVAAAAGAVRGAPTGHGSSACVSGHRCLAAASSGTTPWRWLSRRRTPAHGRGRFVSIRVVLVDDQALVRGGLAMMLRVHEDIEVVAEAGTGLEAIEAARAHRPDVILMDIRMPAMDGLEATSRILAVADWDVRVVILTTFDPDEYVYRALRAGASARWWSPWRAGPATPRSPVSCSSGPPP